VDLLVEAESGPIAEAVAVVAGGPRRVVVEEEALVAQAEVAVPVEALNEPRGHVARLCVLLDARPVLLDQAGLLGLVDQPPRAQDLDDLLDGRIARLRPGVLCQAERQTEQPHQTHHASPRHPHDPSSTVTVGQETMGSASRCGGESVTRA
jgi:hypothetical protein